MAATSCSTQLDAAIAGEPVAGVVSGRAADRRNKIVFVFPGQGSQWLGMGRQLLESAPAFRRALEICDRAVKAEAGWSVIEELQASDASSRMQDIGIVQPLLFSIEVALAALWRSRGFEPSAVVGHSMGEVAAAAVAGALSIEQAAQVICRRSDLLRRVSGQGAMAVVELSLADARLALAGREQHLSVAVSNSSRSTVIAGDPAQLDALIAELEARETFCRRIKVDVASHSPQMDPLRADLLAALAGLQPTAPGVPIYSTLSGHPDGAALDADYWVRNLRAPVLFADAIQRLIADGHDTFIEMSPHPILLPAIEEGMRESAQEGLVAVPSLRRGEDEDFALMTAVATIWSAGYPVSWDRVISHAAGHRRPARLPMAAAALLVRRPVANGPGDRTAVGRRARSCRPPPVDWRGRFRGRRSRRPRMGVRSRRAWSAPLDGLFRRWERSSSRRRPGST